MEEEKRIGNLDCPQETNNMQQKEEKRMSDFEHPQEENKKTRKIRRRTIVVLIALAVFILGSLVMYRAGYIEALEMGPEYIETFIQNAKYKFYIGTINFVIIYILVCMTNKLIKKGLKQFFEEEKREIPKLPNKTLALLIALITSIIVSNLFLQKVILFVNGASFGIADKTFNMDIGFYMFKMLLIRSTFILCSYYIYHFNNICSCILHNSI